MKTTAKDTREKILDSGLKLFSKKGYLGATTKEIAKGAGVAELTLFRHFSSKERLFEEVINSYTFLPALKGLLPEIKGMEFEEALYVIAGRFIERLTERRELIKIMHSEIHLYPAKVKKIYHDFLDEMVKTLAAYFRELQAAGRLRAFNPEMGARAFFGMFFSFFNAQEFLLRKEVKSVEPDMVVRAYVDIFINGTGK